MKRWCDGVIYMSVCRVYELLRIYAWCFSIPLQSMDALKELLSNDSVNVTEIRFRTNEGIDGINTEFLVSSWMLTL